MPVFRKWLYASLALNLCLAAGLLYTFNYFWERERGAAWDLKERRRLQIEEMVRRPVEIVFAGDSLIEEGHWSYWFPGHDIANFGVPGATVWNVFYSRHLITSVRPRKVFLMAGINDLNLSDLTLNTDAAIEAYQALIEGLAAELPDAEICVFSVLPTTAPWPRRFSLETVAPINRAIARAAAEKGFTYIDLASEMAGADGYLKGEYTTDGLHLNAAGYRVWTARVRPYLDAGIPTDKQAHR